jgi:hypothetical protein
MSPPGWASPSSRHHRPVGCAKLALAEPIPPWTVTLATRPNATERPAVAALIEELRSHTRQQHRERMRAQDPHPG